MTIDGAIAQLKELIDNDGIPFWAKPSLQKVMETVEMEWEQHIEELQHKHIACIKVDFSEEDKRQLVKEVVENLKHEKVICLPNEYAQDATEAAETHDFREGELIVYQNGETFQIGEIKRICDDGAFVWYHEGDTASKTPFENMHKLRNAYCITQTSLALDRRTCGRCKYFSICSKSAGYTAAKSSDDASDCDKYAEE